MAWFRVPDKRRRSRSEDPGPSRNALRSYYAGSRIFARGSARSSGTRVATLRSSQSPEINPARRDHRVGAAGRVALDVHGDRIHRDVGGGDLDVNAERGRAAAQALRPDAELVHRIGQLGLDLGAFGIRAGGAERTRRRDLGDVHAEVRGAADANADDGRRTDPPAALDHLVDDEALDRLHAVGGNQHLQERAVLRAGALRDHLDLDGLAAPVEIDVDDRHADAAGGLLVLAGERMHHRRAQRILGGGPRAAAADRLLHRRAVELDVLADDDVVDRNAGVLAQQVLPLLGDHDVLDHGVEHGTTGGVGLLRHQPLEAALDVRRQELDRADVERLGDLFDFLRIELHASS